MTTNFPEKLDDALLRSGRIDLDIELSYLDKYQAKNMFLSFFNDDKKFETLWEMIKKYNIEPSTLLQFLFNKRKTEDISVHYEEFIKMLYKKSQKACNIYT
jgi:chaperone BCS1